MNLGILVWPGKDIKHSDMEAEAHALQFVRPDSIQGSIMSYWGNWGQSQLPQEVTIWIPAPSIFRISAHSKPPSFPLGMNKPYAFRETWKGVRMAAVQNPWPEKWKYAKKCVRPLFFSGSYSSLCTS